VAIPSFFHFLETKPLYYQEIDHLRVHRAYSALKGHIAHPKTIHIVGTNGKGSTGRMIAHLAFERVSEKNEAVSFSVGHYSSPHILKFNERIWLNGGDAEDEVLERAHHRLYAILGREMSEALSYFEYSTLLALVVFEQCDLVVLEAGLGGEYDATNVCDKTLSVITPIGIDHQAFLGDSIGEIAETKIRSIQKLALLAPQVYPEVIEVAERIAKEKKAELVTVGAPLVGARGEDSVRSIAGTHKRCPYGVLENESSRSASPEVEHIEIKQLKQIAKEKGWPGYLVENATVALQALSLLDIPHRISDLRGLELFGRFYSLTPHIRIDVGHNPLAARAIVGALEKETVLIYNSLDDKDYEAVLEILKPKIKRVEIIGIESQRAATIEGIKEALRGVDVPYGEFDGSVDDEEHYLVFGSFYTVEAFLKAFNPAEKEE